MHVPSSVIYGMRYDPRGRMLDVVFRGSGEVYRYFGVPREVWRDFVRSPSKGTFLNTVFKDKNYGYERVKELGPPTPQSAAFAAAGMTEMEGAKAPERGKAGQTFRDVPDANVWGFYE